ncbi:MAG TPA: hypothetical protein VMV13_05280 [Candidatus Binataceae bacterium]|nr:hypothetical protein [Candidatus Binataceae bacterium]
MTKQKTIAALFIWACVGFNSPAAVQQFLNDGVAGVKPTAAVAAFDAKVVTMPDLAAPAFEVFFPIKQAPDAGNGKVFDPATVPGGLICQ